MELNSSETYTWIIFSSVIFLVTGILLYMGKNYSFKFIFFYIAIVILAICCIIAYYSIEEDIKQKTEAPKAEAKKKETTKEDNKELEKKEEPKKEELKKEDKK